MPDSSSQPAVPGGAQYRPSRSQFNRPARTFADLISVPPADFPFVASWTVLGCPPSAEAVASGRSLGDCGAARIAWLSEMRENGRRAGSALPPLPPDLALRLGEYRLGTLWLVGPLLVWLARALRAVTWLRPVDRALRKAAGLVRYSYRHGRKWFRKQCGRLWLMLHTQPASHLLDDLTAEERAIYERLSAVRGEHIGR